MKKTPPVLIHLVRPEAQKFLVCDGAILFVIQPSHHSDPVYRGGGAGFLQLQDLSGPPHPRDLLHRLEDSGPPQLPHVPERCYYESTTILATILGNYTIDMVKDLPP